MPTLSSTSSSDPLRDRFRPAPAALWTLLFLAVLRAALGLVGPDLVHLSDGATHPDARRLRDLLGPPTERPLCLVTGSSRIRTGVVTGLLAESSGLEVRKEALSGGTPWDVLHALRSRPEHLDSIALLVFDLEAFQFNDQGFRSMPPRFRVLSTLTERAEFHGRSALVESVRELWPVERHRHTLWEWLVLGRMAWRRERPGSTEEEEWAGFEAHPSRIERGELARSKIREAVEEHVGPGPLSPFMLRQTERLLEIARGRGIPILILVPPVRKEFHRLALERPAYRAFLEYVRSLQGRPGLTVLATPAPADAGLGDPEEERIYDYGHFTRLGAREYTAWLAGRLSGLPRR